MTHLNTKGEKLKPRGTLGASDCAALFYEHPYMSYYTLWARECGLLAHEEDEHTTRQQMGLDLEKPVLEIWAKREGLQVFHNRKSLVNSALPGLSATPDGLEHKNLAYAKPFEWLTDAATKMMLLEVESTQDVKTVQPHERKQWLDGVPRYYWWQQQQQMLVCGVTHGYLVALFGVERIEHMRIEADKEAHAKIINAADTFWKQVRGELPPPEPDDHKSTLATLMSQKRESKTFDLSDERIADMAYAADCAIKQATHDRADAEKRLRAAKSQMLRIIGDADRGIFSTGEGYEIRTVSKKEFTVKASTSRQLKRFTNKDTEEGEEE